MSSNGTLKRAILFSVTMMAASSILSACAARYRTIHKGLGGGEEPSSSDDATPKEAPPTAGVEVIKGGSSVSKVGAGDDFTIQPTENTRDPDNGDIAGCRNPGIVKAEYKISDGSAPTAARVGASCTSLEVPHKISAPGTYTITLVVTSDENETATSSMTLVVTPAADVDKPDVDGGFTVKASPPVAYPGDPIVFDGDCTNAKLITWAFGDNGTGTGIQTQHAYATPGQYKVDAECERPTGPKLSSSVTITIIPKPTTPGGTDSGDNGGGTNGTGDGDGTDNGGDGTNGNGDGTDNGGDGTNGNGDGTDNGGDGTDNGGDGTSGDGGGTDGGADGKPNGDDGDDDPPGGGNPGQNPVQNPKQNPGQTPYQNEL